VFLGTDPAMGKPMQVSRVVDAKNKTEARVRFKSGSRSWRKSDPGSGDGSQHHGPWSDRGVPGPQRGSEAVNAVVGKAGQAPAPSYVS